MGDKEKTASSRAKEAIKLEDEAAKLHERSERAQERAEITQKEAQELKSGLSGLQGDARAKRSSAERYIQAFALRRLLRLQIQYCTEVAGHCCCAAALPCVSILCCSIQKLVRCASLWLNMILTKEAGSKRAGSSICCTPLQFACKLHLKLTTVFVTMETKQHLVQLLGCKQGDCMSCSVYCR